MTYPDYLPSKKVTVFAVIIAIFIAWLFWTPIENQKSKIKNQKTATTEESLGQKLLNVAASSIDTDNDGLKDWEEALWKTDPKNPDTDGDGTKDGKEIAQKRNPLVAGPDDELKEQDFQSIERAPLGYQEGDNLTEYISQQFISQYLAMKARGEDPTQILPQILTDEIEKVAFEDQFDIQNVSVNNDYSKSALKTYFNSAGKIAYELNRLDSNELAILQRAAEEENYELLDTLSKHIEVYVKIKEELLAISVPLTLLDIHLEMVNISANMEKSVRYIQKLEEDPFLASHGTNEYIKTLERFNVLIDTINAIITKEGIVLLPSDPGYIFIEYQTSK